MTGEDRMGKDRTGQDRGKEKKKEEKKDNREDKRLLLRDERLRTRVHSYTFGQAQQPLRLLSKCNKTAIKQGPSPVRLRLTNNGCRMVDCSWSSSRASCPSVTTGVYSCVFAGFCRSCSCNRKLGVVSLSGGSHKASPINSLQGQFSAPTCGS